jgi:hypothetical protein
LTQEIHTASIATQKLAEGNVKKVITDTIKGHIPTIAVINPIQVTNMLKGIATWNINITGYILS